MPVLQGGLSLLAPAILDGANLGTYHKQGFFEDGTHENVGYFKPNDDGTGGEVVSGKNCDKGGENPNDYDISPYQYDDNLMKQAINNVGLSGNFNPEDYQLTGIGPRNQNNCQDYKTALKKEYKKLGGKVKYRPFNRRKNF